MNTTWRFITRSTDEVQTCVRATVPLEDADKLGYWAPHRCVDGRGLYDHYIDDHDQKTILELQETLDDCGIAWQVSPPPKPVKAYNVMFGTTQSNDMFWARHRKSPRLLIAWEQPADAPRERFNPSIDRMLDADGTAAIIHERAEAAQKRLRELGYAVWVADLSS